MFLRRQIAVRSRFRFEKFEQFDCGDIALKSQGRAAKIIKVFDGAKPKVRTDRSASLGNRLAESQTGAVNVYYGEFLLSPRLYLQRPVGMNDAPA